MKKIIFALFIITSLFIAGCSAGGKSSPAVDQLANCLADKGVLEYGAFWCPNCANQAKKFGGSESILKARNVYVECDPRCIKDEKGQLPKACKGVEGQAENCLENEVDRYPTWDFPDGSRLVGTQELSKLNEKSGCNVEGI